MSEEYEIKTPVVAKQDRTSGYYYILSADNEIIARCNTWADVDQIRTALNNFSALRSQLTAEQERFQAELAKASRETGRMEARLEECREALENVDGWETWAKSGGGYREAFYGLLKSAKAAAAVLAKLEGK